MTNRPTLYLVCGVAGAGKSWVCRQLKEHTHYVSYDENRKAQHISMLLDHNNKPILYDLNIKISTFIRRYSTIFDIHAIFIIESADVIRSRLEGRGGTFTQHIPKRMEVMKARYAKYGEFAGTSTEVLEYLNSKIKCN